MSNCCLFENMRPVERAVEEISLSGSNLGQSVALVNPRARVPAVRAATHDMTIIRPQLLKTQQKSLTGRAKSKSARAKPSAQAFVELMLAAASLLFLALS